MIFLINLNKIHSFLHYYSQQKQPNFITVMSLFRGIRFIFRKAILFQHCSTITMNAAQKSINEGGRRMLHVNNSRRHPYMISVGRLRRYSTSSSSTCSSSSSSEYSQPSPSYSIASYESPSPEPLVSPYAATDCQSPHLVPLGPIIPATTKTVSMNTTTYRSPEREAQVFERLRQLVPMLPFDRSAYQVRHKLSWTYVLIQNR